MRARHRGLDTLRLSRSTHIHLHVGALIVQRSYSMTKGSWVSGKFGKRSVDQQSASGHGQAMRWGMAVPLRRLRWRASEPMAALASQSAVLRQVARRVKPAIPDASTTRSAHLRRIKEKYASDSLHSEPLSCALHCALLLLLATITNGVSVCVTRSLVLVACISALFCAARALLGHNKWYLDPFHVHSLLRCPYELHVGTVGASCGQISLRL
jgi:hypothetical protein